MVVGAVGEKGWGTMGGGDAGEGWEVSTRRHGTIHGLVRTTLGPQV